MICECASAQSHSESRHPKRCDSLLARLGCGSWLAFCVVASAESGLFSKPYADGVAPWLSAVEMKMGRLDFLSSSVIFDGFVSGTWCAASGEGAGGGGEVACYVWRGKKYRIRITSFYFSPQPFRAGAQSILGALLQYASSGQEIGVTQSACDAFSLTKSGRCDLEYPAHVIRSSGRNKAFSVAVAGSYLP